MCGAEAVSPVSARAVVDTRPGEIKIRRRERVIDYQRAHAADRPAIQRDVLCVLPAPDNDIDTGIITKKFREGIRVVRKTRIHGDNKVIVVGYAIPHAILYCPGNMSRFWMYYDID